jgi:hypothetical protein
MQISYSLLKLAGLPLVKNYSFILFYTVIKQANLYVDEINFALEIYPPDIT